jgi:hypothetical protein
MKGITTAKYKSHYTEKPILPIIFVTVYDEASKRDD